MSGADRSWPPLIVAEHIPFAVRWRDILLTLAAWAGFILLVDDEFQLSVGALAAFGSGRAGAAVNWASYAERLAPFFLVGAALAAVLFARSVDTLVGRSRALRMASPAPLATAEAARAAGLDDAALLAARDQRIVVVHDEAHGLRIEPRAVGAGEPARD
jgi:poly-beta-1,6-N-acetyl-D-glucosamine biosynthesis protein PgaD